MKKLICTLLVVISALSFTACGKPYDIAANIPTLTSNGFAVYENLTTPEELTQKNVDIKNKFREYDVDFELDVTEYCCLTKDRPETAEDDLYGCVFIRLKNTSQALSVYSAMLTMDESELEAELAGYKIVRFKDVVVLTNSKDAEKLVGGRFK